MPHRLGSVLVILGVLAAAAWAEDAPELRLRLVHLHDGLRGSAPRLDAHQLKKNKIFGLASRVGLDLSYPKHPLLACAYRDDRLFYVFHKTVDNALGDRPYLLQRIRKTVRGWTAPQGEPEVEVTYLVEAFKTFAGSQKRADQHYGNYGLKDYHRREVVKEYEVGYGEVPERCEGTNWPFEPGMLFERLQPYDKKRGIYDKVRFSRSLKWSLTVTLGEDGRFAVRARELGIDVPGVLPDASDAVPPPVRRSRGIVLVAGEGVENFTLGEATDKDVERVFGKALQVVPARRKGYLDFTVAQALTVGVRPDKTAAIVTTCAGFAGRTATGARHGDDRARIMALYGVPVKQMTDAARWKYPGISFTFDGFHRVARIEISGR
jgi:hypothetical protein